MSELEGRLDDGDASRPGRVRNLVVIAVVLVGLVVAGAAVAIPGSSPPSDGPNVLVIMTDDQTFESLRVMERTREVLAEPGTSFEQAFVSFPVCCPSRATYLTGQYAHNNGVLDNTPPFGGAALLPDETLPVWLQDGGYWTAHVGKYLNTWGADGDISPPPGWDRWFGLVDPTTYRYFGYTVSVDGEAREYGEAVEDYQTDVLGQEVVDTIRSRAGTDQPWFISFTPLAPHNEVPEQAINPDAPPSKEFALPRPAPRHDGAFAGEQAPRGGSVDEADVSDKPHLISRLPALSPSTVDLIDTTFRRELESLQAVDEWVGKIVQTLEETDQLDDTVVIFTSDNGSFHGQHRLPSGKYHLYDPAVHVPLIIRGGGFPAGSTARQPVSNTDLAPTILALADIEAPVVLDGRDLLPVANDPTHGAERGVLLENLGRNGAVHTEAIRTTGWMYAVNERGQEELYDLISDPDQLENVAAVPAYAQQRAALAERLSVLRSCSGSSCAGDP